MKNSYKCDFWRWGVSGKSITIKNTIKGTVLMVFAVMC